MRCVRAVLVAVIGGEDDDGIVGEAGTVEEIHDPARGCHRRFWPWHNSSVVPGDFYGADGPGGRWVRSEAAGGFCPDSLREGNRH